MRTKIIPITNTLKTPLLNLADVGGVVKVPVFVSTVAHWIKLQWHAADIYYKIT